MTKQSKQSQAKRLSKRKRFRADIRARLLKNGRLSYRQLFVLRNLPLYAQLQRELLNLGARRSEISDDIVTPQRYAFETDPCRLPALTADTL